PSAGDAAGWRAIASPADQARIDGLAARWQKLDTAIPARRRPRGAVERHLLDPAAAQPLAAIPPGAYWCRLHRIGAVPISAGGSPDYCFVTLEHGKLAFTRQSGTTLPGGWLFADEDNKRMVLLATDRPAGAASAPAYGSNAARDIVGVIERIGPLKWRLVTPRGDTGPIEIYDLMPAPTQPE
ncbi:MAG: DUF4893 domain-containing protein, partial [Pseudomonadota bacterium]|nr:DUF4893 domain-containing protein [Pseudomonadota bacterium]